MEKVCFELENIELTYLDRTILDIERLAVHQFDRIGIVGKNGAGKSTLLKLLAGIIQPTKGNVHRHTEFAYFDQLKSPDKTEADFELLGKLAVPKTEIEYFSGGEQTRLKLAQIFSNYHEGLLLDEPTTHLDTVGTQFFIDQLVCYYGALILVSHDRYVLDELVTKIWEVEDGTVTEFTGNYSDYVGQKELMKQQQLEQHEKYVKEKSRLIQAAEEKMKKAEKITEASGRTSKKEQRLRQIECLKRSQKERAKKQFSGQPRQWRKE